MTSASRTLHRLPATLTNSGTAAAVCSGPADSVPPKGRGLPGGFFPAQAFGSRESCAVRFSKHFARNGIVTTSTNPRRPLRERKDSQEPPSRRTTHIPSRRSRSTFQNATWPSQAIVPEPPTGLGSPEDDHSSSTFIDHRSYGALHPQHRRRVPGERRVVSRDCLCPDSAFARVRPPPSAAFQITEPGYDSRYQVLAVLATAREQGVERVDTPAYPWAHGVREEGGPPLNFVSDSKCARWILNNL